MVTVQELWSVCLTLVPDSKKALSLEFRTDSTSCIHGFTCDYYDFATDTANKLWQCFFIFYLNAQYLKAYISYTISLLYVLLSF